VRYSWDRRERLSVIGALETETMCGLLSENAFYKGSQRRRNPFRRNGQPARFGGVDACPKLSAAGCPFGTVYGTLLTTLPAE
jgi:hypothetical protein